MYKTVCEKADLNKWVNADLWNEQSASVCIRIKCDLIANDKCYVNPVGLEYAPDA